MELKTFLDKHDIPYMENACMAGYTSFRTGGNASLLILPDSMEKILALLREQLSDYIVLGSCSNILVSDEGVKTPVILLQNNFSDIYMEDGKIHALAGARLSTLANFAISHSLRGLEFAGGIPGSVGGGVFMNAGAYGGELKDCIEEVHATDLNKGELHVFNNEECDFSYRHSRFSQGDLIVLKAVFSLEEGIASESADILRELNRRRKEKQPLEYPSAGSTFKRPAGYYAGALIESSCLKGTKIGGAEVSEKHAGFIINSGDATSRDIYELIKYVQKVVYEKHGVKMEPEVRFIGDFE
ncbi:MAG: UDP-N-acetylmuramate dehydrogenase [Clostridia bacterium]|nr:UDP-N-acetylmuramate dehydrogenase [Clostridia bacterium]